MTRPRQLLRIGPAGNSESFYAEGFKQTRDTFAWQQARFGLDAFEVPFGRGISMSPETARDIGAAASAQGVSLSAHAPYYINLANPDGEAAQKSIRYIIDSARLLALMGGQRLVVHVGSPKEMERGEAMEVCGDRLLEARQQLCAQGLGAIRLCLETMGRPSVLGTLDEIIQLVKLDDSFLPCLDFAHLHAIGGGVLNSPADFAATLDRLEEGIGPSRALQAHFHFSRIEFGGKGEIRHKTFADTDFGPDFNMLMPLLARRGYQGSLICESRGTMAEDARSLKLAYQAALAAINE